MSTETANKAKTITADEIVKDIISVKDLDEMRDDLRFMWEQFVILNEDSTVDERGELFVTYKTLSDALEKMEIYEQQKR